MLTEQSNSLEKFSRKISYRSGYVAFTLLQLLQHNVQLGAAAKFSLLSSHWFIYGVRQRFTVIHLSQTVLNFRYFLAVVRVMVRARRHVLFVNERPYALVITRDVAQSVGEAYVLGRWIGGALTNFKRIWQMYQQHLRYTKLSSLSHTKFLLKKSFIGMSMLRAIPSAVFFNSAKSSFWGSGETYSLHIPTAGITDTDAFPHSVLYPVPGNDDAFGSVLFANKLVAKTILVTKMTIMLQVYRRFCDKARIQALKIAKRKRFNKTKKTTGHFRKGRN